MSPWRCGKGCLKPTITTSVRENAPRSSAFDATLAHADRGRCLVDCLP
jgi:hypothetical protein